MTNFAQAIEQGLSAAAGARTEQDEINEVIKSLTSSVELASGNVVTLALSQRALKTSNDLLHSLAFVLSGSKYYALVLKGKNSNTNVVEVAKWCQEGKGYPVKIGLSSDEYNCPNRDALEHALMLLVATSEFGDAMKTVETRSKRSIRTKVKLEAKLGTDVAIKPATKVVTKPAVKVSAKTTTNVATKKAVKVSAKTATKVATKKAVKASAYPAMKVATKKVTKVSAKPATKIATKPVAKVSAKPATKVATKTVARVSAKPTTKVASKTTVRGHS